MNMDIFPRKKAFKFLLVPIYLVSSLLSTFLNKRITFIFPLTFFVLLIQSILIAVLLIGLRYSRVIYFEIESQFIKIWLPATACMVLMIFSGLKALSLVSISMFTLFKNNTIILIAIAEVYLFRRPITLTSGISFLCMVISSILMSHNDTVKGLDWMLFNVFISGVYVLLLRWSVIQYAIKKNEIQIDLQKERDILERSVYSNKEKPNSARLTAKGNSVQQDKNSIFRSKSIKEKKAMNRKKNKNEHSILVFSEKEVPKIRSSVSDLKKIFEARNTQLDTNSDETNEIYQEAQNLEVERRPHSLDFAALAYTQILSIPFLFVMTLCFDNFLSDKSFSEKFNTQVMKSPDFIDSFLISILSSQKSRLIKQISQNILMLKALFFDLHDISVSYIAEETFILLILSSISIFFVALSSIKIISAYSSTTLSMLGAVNKVLLSLTGIRSEIHELAGIFIGCFASVLYADTLRKE